MRRRAGALLAAVGLAAALLAGCGIPDSTDVRVDGPGPRPGAGGAGQSVAEPPKRGSATDSTTLVDSFLLAPAGEPEQKDERVREYVPPEAQDQLDFESGVSVVDVVGSPKFDGTRATLQVRHIGVLLDNGDLAPPRLDAESTYTMQVGKIEGAQGLYVLQPPPVLLMSRQALNDYYVARTIYYWNQSGTVLVPDLRYLPIAVPDGRVPTEVLTWLTDEPAQTLRGAVRALPEGSELTGTAPIDGGTLTTSWTPETVARDGDVDKLATQIVWSLREYAFSRLVIEVNGAPKMDTDDIDALRAKVVYPVSPNPERFVVLDGSMRRLGATPGVPAALPLAEEVNKNLRSAAILRADEVLAAVIVGDGDGDGGQLRVGSGAGVVTALRPTTPALRTTARPAWLPARTGLVPADGRLYRFGVESAPEELKLPGVSGRVTTVAVSPEGQRIAVIADGRLYIVPLSISGAGPAILAQQARHVATTVGGLTAVAWTSETRVVVAGPAANGRSQLVDITVDGFAESPRSSDATGTIDQISAYPGAPMLRSPVEPVLFQTGDLAWRIEPRTPAQISRSEVAGEAASPAPGTEESKPTSPFYVY